MKKRQLHKDDLISEIARSVKVKFHVDAFWEGSDEILFTCNGTCIYKIFS